MPKGSNELWALSRNVLVHFLAEPVPLAGKHLSGECVLACGHNFGENRNIDHLVQKWLRTKLWTWRTEYPNNFTYIFFYVDNRELPDKNLCPSMSKRELFLSKQKNQSDRKDLKFSQIVLSSKECCHLICVEKLVLALSALKIDVSNGNFPNLWSLDPISFVPFAPFSWSTIYDIDKQVHSTIHPRVR